MSHFSIQLTAALLFNAFLIPNLLAYREVMNVQWTTRGISRAVWADHFTLNPPIVLTPSQPVECGDMQQHVSVEGLIISSHYVMFFGCELGIAFQPMIVKSMCYTQAVNISYH